MQFSSRKILTPLILVIVVLAGFSYYFNYLQKLSLSQTPTEKTPEGESQNLCAEFPKIEGEINCEVTIKIAQDEYPGDIKYINRSEIPMLVGVLPDAETLEQKVWLIGINLREPIITEVGEVKSIELLIYRDNGKFEPHIMMSEEIENQNEIKK